VYPETAESHFASALAAITLAGDVSKPGLVTKRGIDHPDAQNTSFFAYVSRYYSGKAFMTRSIFSDSLRTVVRPFLQKVRAKLGSERARAVVLLDGHKSHTSEVISLFTGHDNIIMFLLPSQSVHCLQPLGQGFFRRMKAQFAQYARIQEFVTMTSTCERFFMAFQDSLVTRIIWKSLEHSVIVSVIANGT
jgi:hypothetical protein